MVQPRIPVPLGSGRYGGVPVRGDVLQRMNQAFRGGLGVTRTREILRTEGFRFRNQVVTDRFRELRTADAASGNLQFLSPNARPGARTLIQRNIRSRTRYTFTGNLNFIDPADGSRAVRTFQFGTDELLTRSQIEAKAREIANSIQAAQDINEKYEFVFELQDIELRHAFEDVL